MKQKLLMFMTLTGILNIYRENNFVCIFALNKKNP